VRTFEEQYCAKHGIPPEQFVEAVFRRTLYPAGRLLRPLLALDSGYFTADRNFIKGVGRITRFRDFEGEARDYLIHPENQGFLRRVLRLRVSVYRVLRIVRSVMREDSKAPFEPGKTAR